MFPFHNIILCLFFQFSSLLFFSSFFNSILFMKLDQFELLLIVWLASHSSSSQSSPVVHCGLSFKEKINIIILKHKHLLILSNESKSGDQFSWSFEIHYLGFDCIVGGFDASVLLLEGIADNTSLKKIYLAVSLQRMLSPSLKAWGSLFFSIMSRIASTRSSLEAISNQI